MSDIQKLRAVLIGCGGMGRNQARVLAQSDHFELLAVCDTSEERAKAVADEVGVKYYLDAREMLAKEKPETVSVPTSNTSHAPLTILAANTPGVLGVYCEKPMAMNMKEARAMVEACRQNKVALVINHQRRLGPDLTAAKRLIDEGAIGEVRLVRGQCAGDILSDGTHLIDSCMFLLGDPQAQWVLAQIHREIDADMIERSRKQREEKGQANEPGFRFGHAVENGGMAEIGLGKNLRFEILCGDMREENRIYQDYEVFGTKGRIWRTGDGAKPNLYIQDEKGGDWAVGVDERWTLRPLPPREGVPGAWRPVELPENHPAHGIPGAYERFYRMIRHGEPHPMNGDIALRHFEVLMAVYESARIAKKIIPPLGQDRFPLEVMIEDGRA